MTDENDVNKEIPVVLPVLPLRNIVVFPGMIVPLFVGREKSIRALEDVMSDEKEMLLVSQRDGDLDDPQQSDMHQIGTIGTVLQMLKLPDGTVKVLVEGKTRARILDYLENDGFFEASAIALDDDLSEDEELEALMRSAASQFDNYVKLNRKIPPEVQANVGQIKDPVKMADTIAGHLNISLEEKQSLLEILSVSGRLEAILGHMEGEVGVLQVEKKIRGRVKRQMEKTQREYYLNEQMKAIQKELGEGEEGGGELAELEQRIADTKFSKEAREKAESELKKLKSMSPMSAEATVVRNYLDWLLCLPWGKKSRIKKDLAHAEKVLNADHFGLEKVKERILEYLAVQQRSKKLRGPILCLGPGRQGVEDQIKHIEKLGGIATGVDGWLEPQELSNLQNISAVMWWGDNARDYLKVLARRAGPIIPLITEEPDLSFVIHERHICVDTTAAGGNAKLLAG